MKRQSLFDCLFFISPFLRTLRHPSPLCLTPRRPCHVPYAILSATAELLRRTQTHFRPLSPLPRHSSPLNLPSPTRHHFVGTAVVMSLRAVWGFHTGNFFLGVHMSFKSAMTIVGA